MQQTRHHLDHLLDSAFESFQVPDEPGTLYDPVRYTIHLGGKRLRPKLLLLTTGLCGGDVRRALPAALAVELLHNFTLIHDDIMDRADTRRGRPSVRAKWNDATAILSGDVMFALALKQLVGTDQPDSETAVIQNRQMQILLETIQTICTGQALDMQFETREEVHLEEYVQMIGAKTAVLFRCSMQMGAILAEADEQTIQRCCDIGNHAGLAFQIQDDLLDAVGDAPKFGKKVGGDIVEGKKTCLSILALERADAADREILMQILGDRSASESDILQVTRIYHNLGVIDDVAKMVALHYNNALEKLDFFEDSGFGREIKYLFDKLRLREN